MCVRKGSVVVLICCNAIFCHVTAVFNRPLHPADTLKTIVSVPSRLSARSDELCMHDRY